MPVIKLIVAYDGTHYYGWQKTKAGPSLEGTLQTSLETILQQKVRLNAASRTDRGVHALEQTVSFQADKVPSLTSLNHLLPEDITALKIDIAPDDFHATLAAKGKTYRYDLTTARYQLPQHRLYEWHIPLGPALNLDLMRKAANLLIGTKDFKSLTNRKKETYRDTTRTVTAIHIEEKTEGRLSITLEGESFLYKMVRNLVGLLVFAGRGKVSIEAIPSILAAKDRRLAALSAPAHGLTLLRQLF